MSWVLVLVLVWLLVSVPLALVLGKTLRQGGSTPRNRRPARATHGRRAAGTPRVPSALCALEPRPAHEPRRGRIVKDGTRRGRARAGSGDPLS